MAIQEQRQNGGSDENIDLFGSAAAAAAASAKTAKEVITESVVESIMY